QRPSRRYRTDRQQEVNAAQQPPVPDPDLAPPGRDPQEQQPARRPLQEHGGRVETDHGPRLPFWEQNSRLWPALLLPERTGSEQTDGRAAVDLDRGGGDEVGRLGAEEGDDAAEVGG